ncbi:MAG TPA: hypothetical protein VN622_02850 [Clostridia bacterium]|nr:hypothetical protein [Clostridia bacterium]
MVRFQVPPRRKSQIQISWTTITYRSVVMAVLLFLALCGIISYIVFPQPTKNAIEAAGNFAADMLAKVGVGNQRGKSQTTGPQQAHFTNIDGTVRVKKSSSNTWSPADYSTPLEKGDVVQTGSEGMARVIFGDGTSYTVKQDSLIVIEDNFLNANQQTQVSVQVTTGTVDLSTATFSQGSRAQVVVAGATAAFSSESSAQVRNDPRRDEHEILVKKGAGEVTRGNQVVRLSDYEKVSFKLDSPTMAKEKQLGPPTLIGPANMAPIFATGKQATVQFSWTPVEKSAAYRVRVSRNPYFSSVVLDEKVVQPQIVSSMHEGAYYWMVQSLDAAGRESIDSEKNRFTVIPRGAEPVPLALELHPFVQHGHVIEVRGKTESTARVMVNGQEVPMVAPDGSFQYLTPPLPSGENVITITAQNTKGGVNTQQKKVVIQ